MIVYRITLAKFANALVASGNPARWNSKDVKAIYTAGSRSLACLENVVHRTSLGLQDNFRTILVSIPDDMAIEMITTANLNPNWQQYGQYPYTQGIGDDWIQRASTAVLRVPSAIIPEEHNYIINPLHPDFQQIKYLGHEAFNFDERIKLTLP